MKGRNYEINTSFQTNLRVINGGNNPSIKTRKWLRSNVALSIDNRMCRLIALPTLQLDIRTTFYDDQKVTNAQWNATTIDGQQAWFEYIELRFTLIVAHWHNQYCVLTLTPNPWRKCYAICRCFTNFALEFLDF